MDPRLLEQYNQELQFIREMGAEFSERYPKIAGGLGLRNTECDDPYVERLLESFAFLTARIQIKLNAEYPHFTQHLLEMVYPHYLGPTPSMTVVEFQPDLKGGVTEEGFLLKKQTELRSTSTLKGRANCEYRTAHDLMLWPIQLTAVDYLSQGEAVHYAGTSLQGVKAGIRFRLETVVELEFKQLAMDRLSLYLKGSGGLPMQVYELLLGHSLAVVVQPSGKAPEWREILDGDSVQPVGFDDQQALLPYGPRSFQGYRFLQEYFALPQRYMFVELQNLLPAVQRSTDTQLEFVILLAQAKTDLEDRLNVTNFSLNCTPAINLFPKRSDRVHLTHRTTEHQLVIDRTRPRDYEVFSITELEGYGSRSNAEQKFRPFYALQHEHHTHSDHAYYTLRRQPVLQPINTGATGSHYHGSEVYIALVDASEAPYPSDLKQLGADTLCTNRDLPQLMVTGQGNTDFTLKIGAPVDSVRCLCKPTDPKPAYPEGEHAWRLISHLSLNYLSLINDDTNEGAGALRELLRLYGDFSEAPIRKQIDGLLTVNSEQVVRRIPGDGPMAFGRGLEITLTFDELAFEGSGAFLLGAVLDRFFSKYVSINSFIQTVVTTQGRGEIMRWPVRTGTRTLM
ncbi:Protein ImpG/VasA [hydrothermal vent metagenome]|uniref:Protein ImpG/VasA n=1 Tax=hydrothermal vent metagenome TaxID=652676 RepID=A0A3B0YN48_9ZZZZ